MQDQRFLDVEEAIELMGGDEEIYREILQTFSSTYGRDSLKKEMAVIANFSAMEILQEPTLREKAMKEFHKIKGASLAVGAKKLGASAKALEILLKQEALKADEETVLTFESFKNEFSDSYDRTIDEINNF